MVVKAPESIALDRKGQHAIRELRKARAELDELKLKISKYETTLKNAAGPDGGTLTVGGRPVATYTVTITRTLSKTLVEKRAPEIIEECTVLGTRRVLKLIEDE